MGEHLDLLIKILEIAGTVIGALFSAAWFLIGKFNDGQEKIKKMETADVLRSVNDLKEKIAEHRSTVIMISSDMKKWREDIIRIQERLASTSKNDESFSKSLESMRELLEHRIRLIEGTLDDGEILKIGQNRFMFKGRKRE